MQGGQRVGAVNLGTLPTNWHIESVGDFNGDGSADILWRENGGQAVEWLIKGGQRIGSVDLGVIPTSWHIDNVANFDGNATDDLLWRNDNGTRQIWLMDSTGHPSSVSNLGVMPTTWHSVDHHFDIV